MNDLVAPFIIKIDKLLEHILILRLADYAYPDSNIALTMLETKAKHLKNRVKTAADYSQNLQIGILRETNSAIARLTNVVGIVSRSTTVRNPFELYIPFLKICKSLLGEDAKLLLAAEWQYVPFTHPQTLADLPNFIVIGLPAPECDNVLIFPAAGHELGHSIWSGRNLRNTFSLDVNRRVEDYFINNVARIKNIYPEFREADFAQDMFVANIKSAVVNCVMAQAEELFCDFVGMLLFGESYLLMFSYLIAPQLTGTRSLEYPDTKARIEMLIAESSRLSIPVKAKNYNFISETVRSSSKDNFIVEAADTVISETIQSISTTAQGILNNPEIQQPTIQATETCFRAFEQGTPFEGDAALGDLINAAWRIFQGKMDGEYAKQGRNTVDYLADLVMKSSEIHELRDYINVGKGGNSQTHQS